MRTRVAVAAIFLAGAVILGLASRAGADPVPTWSVSQDGTHVVGTDVYYLLYKLPAVPTATSGCQSLQGYRMPSGSKVPANWVVCKGAVSFTFPASVHGATFSGYFYGGTRNNKITVGTAPAYTTTLP